MHAGVWVQKRKIYTMGVNNSNMVNDMTSLVLVLRGLGSPPSVSRWGRKEGWRLDRVKSC